jgi:glycosyltransferase involved in cell wall biosynthesis
MHPDYEPAVQAFVAADPARTFRQTVDMARLQARPIPRILSIVHNLGGGTVRHIAELAGVVGQRAIMLSLTPGANQDVVLRWMDPRENLELVFLVPEEFEDLVQALKIIGISHIHVQHLLGHSLQILELPQRLRVPYDFTAHDYHVVCPQVSMTYPGQGYCGELGVHQCGNCLHLKSAPNNFDIVHWRAVYGGFAERASHLLVPSRDAGRRLARYLPMADIRLAPHTDLEGAALPEPAPALVASRANLRVVVIGAISAIKGADTLEAVALQAAHSGAPMEFHLVGYAYRALHSQPHASLTVHGPYADENLPRLLERLKPDVVWFPALWPETYSYTLSACLKVGVPIVAPDLGAFAERLHGRRWTWLKRWDTPPAEWFEFFQHIRHEHFETGQEPERPHTAVTVGADALIYDWSYDNEYLQDLPIAPGEPPASHAFVLSHQGGRSRATDGAA